MTARDLETNHPGYWPSPWPVECGGNRRQKARAGRLDAASGTAEVTTSVNGRWNVMVIRRDPGEWFVGGTMASFVGEAPHGWVQRIDPETLDVLADTGPLPCGEHVWCGAVAAHANGSLYNVNGSHLHKISAACEVEVERVLPDQAHNGLLILSDGSIITKDLRLRGQGPSTLSRFDPETLEDLHSPVQIPQGSMGRIAADVDADGVEFVYVPGITEMFRLRVEPDGLVLDESWQPTYRGDDSQGLSWDTSLSAGHAWFMDNGDIQGIRTIFDHHPNGRIGTTPAGRLSWQHPAPWPGPQRLLRANLETGSIAEAAPFDAPGGGIIAPPLHVPEQHTIVCWDSINGGLAGLDDETLETRWLVDVRATMQPVVFTDSGEMVINEFTPAGDQLVVVDVATGGMLDRVDVGSRLANGMFLTAGDDRDVYYCSTLTLARVAWR